MRNNLQEQLRWLGSCQSWADAFGSRLSVEALNQPAKISAEEVSHLSIEKDWVPLWRRAAEGRLHGGDVEVPARAARERERQRPSAEGAFSGAVWGADGAPRQMQRQMPPAQQQMPAQQMAQGQQMPQGQQMQQGQQLPQGQQMPPMGPQTEPPMPMPLQNSEVGPGAWQAPPPVAPEQRAPSSNWAQGFEWDGPVAAALQRFGVPGFRPQQREAINACLAGKDVFVRMPTGGGKSLVYQVPAVVQPLVVVISPLVSLIQDQVQELKEIGVEVSAIRSRSDESGEDVRMVTRRMLADELQIVYVTPEMIHQSSIFQKALRSLYTSKRLRRFVIDEAHCLSIWGNEFRESYLQLKNLKASFPEVPILACSATATEEIISGVLTQLNMQDPAVFVSPVDRPNLEFKVQPKSKKSVTKEIGDLIRAKFSGQSGIIYCLSRQNCDDVQQELASMQIRAEVYHAQVALHQRSAVQQRWKSGETPIIVATIAFGMGVNKRDVRFVIHHSFPKSLEGYYQEAGRAGRDGCHATCTIFYDYEDKKRHQNLAQNDMNQDKSLQRLLQMVGYCEALGACRRAFIAGYFGDVNATCGVHQAPCDVCRAAQRGQVLQQQEVTQEAQVALQLLRAARAVTARGRLAVTLHSVKEALLGSKAQRMAQWQALPGFGALKGSWGEGDTLRLLRKLVVDSVLAEEVMTPGGASGNVTVAYLVEGRHGEALLQNQMAVHLYREPDRKRKARHSPEAGPTPGNRNRAAPKRRTVRARALEDGRSQHGMANPNAQCSQNPQSQQLNQFQSQPLPQVNVFQPNAQGQSHVPQPPHFNQQFAHSQALQQCNQPFQQNAFAQQPQGFGQPCQQFDQLPNSGQAHAQQGSMKLQQPNGGQQHHRHVVQQFEQFQSPGQCSMPFQQPMGNQPQPFRQPNDSQPQQCNMPLQQSIHSQPQQCNMPFHRPIDLQPQQSNMLFQQAIDSQPQQCNMPFQQPIDSQPQQSTMPFQQPNDSPPQECNMPFRQPMDSQPQQCNMPFQQPNDSQQQRQHVLQQLEQFQYRGQPPAQKGSMPFQQPDDSQQRQHVVQQLEQFQYREQTPAQNGSMPFQQPNDGQQQEHVVQQFHQFQSPGHTPARQCSTPFQQPKHFQQQRQDGVQQLEQSQSRVQAPALQCNIPFQQSNNSQQQPHHVAQQTQQQFECPGQAQAQQCNLTLPQPFALGQQQPTSFEQLQQFDQQFQSTGETLGQGSAQPAQQPNVFGQQPPNVLEQPQQFIQQQHLQQQCNQAFQQANERQHLVGPPPQVQFQSPGQAAQTCGQFPETQVELRLQQVNPAQWEPQATAQRPDQRCQAAEVARYPLARAHSQGRVQDATFGT
ncbi:unnamed protein product [Effrenium voratum]|uniref:DNA 3'-5' helicase n=1 Tax=Effrenium voratum TaxID=2562239 RepID=A0AA36N2N3_9DINO|nr:unnamed protein product [Effrenium voratum]CAJ1436750.1 unnamed protein product [Effrenium voratum]